MSRFGAASICSCIPSIYIHTMSIVALIRALNSPLQDLCEYILNRAVRLNAATFKLNGTYFSLIGTYDYLSSPGAWGDCFIHFLCNILSGSSSHRTIYLLLQVLQSEQSKKTVFLGSPPAIIANSDSSVACIGSNTHIASFLHARLI